MKKNIGLVNENLGVVIRPYSLPLSLDYVDFDCKFVFKIASYIIDNGEFINIYIFDQNKSSFYEEIFNVKSYADINQAEGLLENDNDLSKRIFNIINQMKIDNKGNTQPVRVYFLNEKSINKDELTSMLVEDQYKDELFYVDFLAEVHSSIQTKMS